MSVFTEITAARTAREKTFRRQLLWAACWALFCALWQPVLYELWLLYSPQVGPWLLLPLWILAGSPALTFFWFYQGRLGVRRFLEMLLLYGPVSSLLMGWLFWSGVVLGSQLLKR